MERKQGLALKRMIRKDVSKIVDFIDWLINAIEDNNLVGAVSVLKNVKGRLSEKMNNKK